MSDVRVRPSDSAIDDFMPFNPYDPAFAANPYPHYQRLRENSPIHRTPGGVWYITRHADISALLRDRRVGHGDGKVETKLLGWLGAASQPSGGAEVRAFFGLDPPDHTRLRGMVSKAFTPRKMRALAPRIQQIVDELLDEGCRGDEADLIAALAYPLPVIVICELLGVPPEDRTKFKGWSDALARGLDPDFLQTPEELKQRWQALVEFRDFFLDLVARHRQEPKDDLLSSLLAVEEEGEFLTVAELLANVTMMVIAGAETTVNFLGNSMLALLSHPDQLAYYLDHSDDEAVYEEFLRYDAPVQLSFRIALEDIEIGGQRIRAGEMIIPVFGAANRDPEVFTEPDRLDLTRTGHHLAFGTGIHSCFGATLGKVQGYSALPSLWRRAPDIRLTGETLTYKPNVLLRGMTKLPVRLR